ncbi:MAG: LD-carboxypeptidase [Candidatus Kapabacteria bacterium]|nr:LD-carboxypeptidase [Candidatus Kapabacteria bacterium]
MNRSTFITMMLGSIAATTAFKSLPLYSMKHSSIIKPKALNKNSTIAITAPAGASSVSDIQSGIDFFQSMGLKVVIGNTVKTGTYFGYLSAPDTIRATEFMNFVKDPSIDAIVCARGGYGVMRMLPYLDFDVIRDNPKIIMGFSDITALATAIFNNSGLVNFHGPVASSSYNKFTVDSLKKSLFLNTEQPFEYTPYIEPTSVVLAQGTAEGRLVGGNLSMLVATMGTPYEIQTKDSILFMEEILEEPYRVDRMITQLLLGGKLDDCNGIIMGHFTKCEATSKSASFKAQFSLREVLMDRFQHLSVPVLYGFPFGHILEKLTIPFGVKARISTEEKSLTLLESPVIYEY